MAYAWVPVFRGEPLSSGAVMTGRTRSDGDVYVGRNAAGEVGKLNLEGGKMHQLLCHHGGLSYHGDYLLKQEGAMQEWMPYRSGDPLPPGAVQGGNTETDGLVYVGRTKDGDCGKINLNKDGTMKNLWAHGNIIPWRRGEVLTMVEQAQRIESEKLVKDVTMVEEVLPTESEKLVKDEAMVKQALPIESENLLKDLNENVTPLKEVTHLIRSSDGESFKKKYMVTKKALGSGMSGSVMLAKVRGQDFDVAVKTLPTDKLSDLQREQLLDEVCNQLNMDHPNICKLLEVYIEPKRLRLVIERMKGPNLLDHLNREGYKEKDAAAAVQQMLKAVAYIHSKNVVHRDLKLENFCLEDDSPAARIKMIDFGLSDKLEQGAPLTHACGSLLYVAPEVLKKKYTEKADIWSMGVITYALLVGQPPFDGRDDREISQNIMHGELKFPNDSSRLPLARMFIQKLLTRDPDTRPSALEALEHDWFKCLYDGSGDDETLSEGILDGMRKLSRSNGLKKALLSILAPKATAKEVSKWADEFETLDEKGTGMVQMKDMANRLVEVSGCSNEEADEIAKSLAAIGDNDMVSYSAFLTACLSSNMAMLSDEDLKVLCQNLDRDGDQFIDGDELKRTFQGVVREEDIPSGKLTYGDVRWLLLGPRNAALTTKDDLQKLLCVSGVDHVWKCNKRHHKERTNRAPVGLANDTKEEKTNQNVRAKMEDKKVRDERTTNLAWRKMGMGVHDECAQTSEDMPSTSCTLVASANIEKTPSGHLDTKEVAGNMEEASRQAVKEIVEMPKLAYTKSHETQVLQDLWSASTNEAKSGDVEAIRRENLAFRKLAMEKEQSES